MKNSNVKKLCVSAVMLALATALSLVKVWQMPLGGSVTLCSMLPICLLSILYGDKWGFLTAFAFSLIQLFISLVEVLGWGLSPWVLAGTIMLDYVLAFTSLGFAGTFRKNGTVGILLGVVLACAVRLLLHIISGVVLFTNLEQYELFGNVFEAKPILYSICYNGFYMVPEMALTVICTVIVIKTKIIKVLKIKDE